jgi:3-methyladenine DNA glycosylase Tag
MRCVLDRAAKSQARAFIRRFTALCAAELGAAVRWRPAARVAAVAQRELPACVRFVHHCANAFVEVPIKKSAPKSSPRQAVRRMTSLLRVIESVNAATAGSDAAARFYRRYMADHDAPADDATAYRRLCYVVLAQGLSFAAVAAREQALDEAFRGFLPKRVAGFAGCDIEKLLSMPIIRNAAKLHACVENAKRWQAAALPAGSYMARVAACAAQDDAAGGWPKLVDLLTATFVRAGASSARQALKRWGFFTVLAHPAALRLLSRLRMLEQQAGDVTTQLFICAVAQATGRDPYAIEAALVLFAERGPCRASPRCSSCELCENCPTGFERTAEKLDGSTLKPPA